MKLGFFVKIKSCHKKIKKDYLVKTLKNYFLKKLNVWLALIKMAIWEINYQTRQCIDKKNSLF